MPWLKTAAKFFWPVTNIAGIIAAPDKAVDSVPATKKNIPKPVADTLEDHAAVQLGTLPKLVLAAFIWHRFVDVSAAKTLSLDWMLPIFIRDLVLTYVLGGGWDFLLYSKSSPFFAKMAQFKLNPVYPKPAQLRHDMFWSTVSTIISSVFEIVLLHLWASGRLAFTSVASGAWWTHVPTLLWLLTMPYWRLAHFYAVHRFMHKWGTTSIPDVGAWMYKYVHSLHHKSRNPTAWSGVSMHPVESTIYYTAMLIPVAFAAHPLVALYTKLDLTLAALIGHDGFGAPGAASSAHWLHHNMVNCNYGENYAPFDWLFGSFAADEDDFMARFGKSAVAEAGKTKTH